MDSKIWGFSSTHHHARVSSNFDHLASYFLLVCQTSKPVFYLMPWLLNNLHVTNETHGTNPRVCTSRNIFKWKYCLWNGKFQTDIHMNQLGLTPTGFLLWSFEVLKGIPCYGPWFAKQNLHRDGSPSLLWRMHRHFIKKIIINYEANARSYAIE